MRVFQNGKWYWFQFVLNGVRHRMSTKTTNKEDAKRIAAEYRRNLTLGQVGLKLIDRKPKLFSTEVNAYVELMQPAWKPKTYLMHKGNVPKVTKFFGKMILSEITDDDIRRYQALRKQELTKFGTPPSNRSINIEIALLRQVLVKNKLWWNLREGSELRMLKENHDIGRELSEDELWRLLDACRNSKSRALYTAVLLSVFTGVRSSELKRLRWNQLDLIKATLTVGKSKSIAGEGRTINLSPLALEVITNWRSNFVALPQHFVFPAERYSNGHLYLTIPEKGYSTTFDGTWREAKKVAEVECRWHDLRHSCTSMLADSGASDATLKALLGWMSDKMIERYSHTRDKARKAAVESIDACVSRIMPKSQPERETIQ